MDASSSGRTGAGPGELSQPGDVFVDRNGAIWVADGRNNRIARYDSQGNYIGSVTLPGAPGPVPFNEPWSVAVDEQGFVYVADTWNHRIVKFSASLQFLTTWGRPAAQTTPPGPLDLFGPRDIMIAEDGTLLVTDTGHNRLINYTRDGQPIADYGLQGTDVGKFQEPVSVARDIQGRIYIADAWNGRIQRFDRGFTRRAGHRGSALAQPRRAGQAVHRHPQRRPRPRHGAGKRLVNALRRQPASHRHLAP